MTKHQYKKNVVTEYSTEKSKILLFIQLYPEQAWEENGRIFIKKEEAIISFKEHSRKFPEFHSHHASRKGGRKHSKP